MVTRLRSDYSQRQRRAQAISATGYLSSQWRTPTDDSRRGGPQSGLKRLDGGHTMNLQDQVQDFSTWLTPDANVINDGEQPETFRARQAIQKAKGINGNGMGMPLAMAAKTWPTPTARDWKDTGDMTNVPENALLGRVAMNWSTPSVADTTRGRMARSGERSSEMLLKGQAALLSDQWMTPRVQVGAYTRDGGDPDKERLTLEGQAIASQTLASSLPDHPISTVGEESSKIRRTLNPRFVEWLMGWPRGWTSAALTPPASNDSGCSATALSLWKQRMRSKLWSLGLPPEAQPAQLSLL